MVHSACVLVKDTQRGIADRDGGLYADSVLAVVELLVLVHPAQLALRLAQQALVADAETGATAVDAKGIGTGNRGGGSEKGSKRYHFREMSNVFLCK